MNCDELAELAPAYAAGALDAEERSAVDTHLAECLWAARDRALIADYHALLLLAFDEPDASSPLQAGMQERILVASRAQSPARGGGRPRRRWRWPTAAAAVVLAVFIGTLGVFITRDEPGALHYVYRSDAGAELRVDGNDGRGPATVTMAGFAPQEQGLAYQVWAIRDGAWLSIGVCNTNEAGWWHGDFAFTLASGDEIALTVAPEGGGTAEDGRIALREVVPMP